MTFERYLRSLLQDTGQEGTEAGEAIEDLVASIGNCPACGEVMDFCQGHGEFGDPEGRQVLDQHDAGDHSSCNPRGCEEANDA